MTDGDALRRKLRKLRRSPAAFLRDSKLAPLQALGRAVERVAPSLAEPEETIVRPATVRGIDAILHIGDGKCGSTSIQASLFEARDRLERQSIVYHPVNRTSGHFHYGMLLGETSRDDHERQVRVAAKNLEENAARIASGEGRFVIFSGESLFRVPPADVMGLLERGLTRRIEAVHVIGYVRRPADMYLSLMQQKLKASHRIVQPHQYVRDIHQPFAAWAAHPSCASVTVRPFDRTLLEGASVVRDFQRFLADTTGRDVSFLEDRRENESLSAEQMILLQRFRRDFTSGYDGVFRPESTRLIALFHGLNGVLGMVGTKASLSELARAHVVAGNGRFVRALRESFDLTLDGWCDSSGTPSPQELEPWSSTDVAAILGAHDPRTVDALRALVPPYEPELRSRLAERTRAAMASLGFDGRARRAYAKYLAAEGCERAREELLALG